MQMGITFLGGAGTVTGSKYLLNINGKKILIDCGLFQGIKEHRLLNWQPFLIGAQNLDAVILTHAHLDHTGYLPLLVKQGYRGPIYCSEPTAELTRLILLDSAKIQEEDAERANLGSYSKHKPALPLYVTADSEASFDQFKTLSCNQWVTLFNEIQVRLSNSGHILGSTFVEINASGKIIVFTGDLGRKVPITLKPRVFIERADYLVTESTYGDRNHPSEHPIEILVRLINKTLKGKGTVLIPTFAVGRTQDILHMISIMKLEKRIPDVPVYLDSPMADKATALFDRFSSWHRLSSPDLKRLSATYEHVSSPQHSMTLCRSKEPAIVLAGSGMMTGGRIKEHLVARLPRERNTVAIVGYQAAGTLGRFLKEGAEEVKLFGKYVPVRARIAEISSLSAHADQREILEWISGFKPAPKKVFIVHGEPNASEGLRVRLSDQLGVVAPFIHVSKLGENVELN